MNCSSCGTPLVPGTPHCSWCGAAPQLKPPSRSASRQFATPPSSPSPYSSQKTFAPLHSHNHPPVQNALPMSQASSSSQVNIYSMQLSSNWNGQHLQAVMNGGQQHNLSQKALSLHHSRNTALRILMISLAILCVLGILIGVYIAHGTMSTFNASATMSTRQQDNPTGYTINPHAATILSHPQATSGVDISLAPTQPTRTFKTGQRVYVTFHINSQGQDGIIEVRWYAGVQQVAMSMFHHAHENITGLVSYVYTIPTTLGVAALFWCTQQGCSDAQLAFVLHFTVLEGNTPLVALPSIDVSSIYRCRSFAPALIIRRHAFALDC